MVGSASRAHGDQSRLHAGEMLACRKNVKMQGCLRPVGQCLSLGPTMSFYLRLFINPKTSGVLTVGEGKVIDDEIKCVYLSVLTEVLESHEVTGVTLAIEYLGMSPP